MTSLENLVFTQEVIPGLIVKQILTINGASKIYWYKNGYDTDLDTIQDKIRKGEIEMLDDLKGVGTRLTSEDIPHSKNLTCMQRYFPCCYTIEVQSSGFRFQAREDLSCEMDKPTVAAFVKALSSNPATFKIRFRKKVVERKTWDQSEAYAKVTIMNFGALMVSSKGPIDAGSSAGVSASTGSFQVTSLNEQIPSHNWIEVN